MADTTRVYHPTIVMPDGTVPFLDVADDLVKRHQEQGWLLSEPKSAAVKAAKKAAASADPVPTEPPVE